MRYIGVTCNEKTSSHSVRVGMNGKLKQIGTWQCAIDAAAAYNAFASKLGRKLNDVPQIPWQELEKRRLQGVLTKKKSAYGGVSRIDYAGKKRTTVHWQAIIQSEPLGRFKTEREAAEAFNTEAIKRGYPEWKLNKFD